MTQQLKQRPAKRRFPPMILLKVTAPLWKQIKGKTTQKEDEAFIQTLRAVGMTEENIPKMLTLIDGMHKARKKREVDYKSDKIFVAGIAALNLILLQVLATISKPDFASYLSWIFFALSLPCVGGFLYMSQLQERNESYVYSPVHERLAGISVQSGAIAAIALAWHFRMVAGIILLTTSLLIFCMTALFRIFNDVDFANAINTIVNETTGDTHEKEN